MRCVFVLMFAAVCPLIGCSAARGPSDTIEAAGGASLVVSPIGHGTVHVSSGADAILVDPVPGLNYEGLVPPTAIVVTHAHDDHFNAKTIAERRLPATVVIVPRIVGNAVPGATLLRNGEQRVVRGMTIEAVPMYNPVGERFHLKGDGNGYVVTLAGRRLYFAGDTGCTDEMKGLKNIDVAFLPMNMPFTMEPATAAQCARAFAPKIVYPYHFRGSDPREFDTAMSGSGLDVRLRRWY